MFISDFAIKRPLVTVVAMVTLAVFGIFALWRLQTDEFPDVAEPVVFTAIIYPGASPDQVETEVLDPVEEAIQGISGVDQIFGSARDGYAEIVTVFLYEKDLKEATQDIRDAISAIRQDLPTEMEEPVLRRFSPNDFPIMQISLTSSALGSVELSRIAEPGVTRELRSIPGVAQVDVTGLVEPEMTVQLRPEALQAMGVSVAQVVQALQFQNLAVPVGRLNGALDERTIRLKGRLEGPDDFARMVVADRNGQIIRLGDVADVFEGHEEQRSAALYNQQEAVGISITKAKGFSTTDVSDKIREKIVALQPTMPAGTKLEIVRDAGIDVERSVASVQSALIEGAILTVLVVFLFLNSWRSTVITGLALPISVLAAFIAVWVLGFKLETMSLLGLSLAIGILIDDAIVVRENIVRHVEMGKDHWTAAHEGTNEIGLAVTATTMAIVSVFVPVGFMYGVAGQWFRPFALTIASAVLVSLFVSFSLDPMLSAYWADPHVPEEKKRWITRQLDKFNRWFNAQASNYKKVVAWSLDHRAAMIVLAVGSLYASFTLPAKGFSGLFAAMLGIGLIVWALATRRLRGLSRAPVALVGLGIALMLPSRVPELGKVGGSFFPVDDRSEFSMTVETPPGSNLDYLRIKTDEILRIVRAHEDVVYSFATLGTSAGAVDEAQIYVKMKPKNERDISAEAFAQRIRDELGVIAGATVAVFTNDMFGNQKQIQIQLRGTESQSLALAAEMVRDSLEAIPGAVDVGLSSKGQKPEFDVQINRGLAGTLGVTVGQVAQSLRPAFAGLDAGDWDDPRGETRDVMVRFAPEYRRRPTDLEHLPVLVAGETGPRTMPLGNIATVRPSLGPAQINHLDRDKVVTVQANTQGRSMNEVMGDMNPKLAAMQLPPGVRITQGGEVESQAEVFGRILAALGIAIMLMYLILVLQFGSFLDPLAIMLSLPLSLIGVMLALGITRHTINLMSMIGVILLAGIVAKNAILLIDFAKWAREKAGLPLRDALIEAGAIRLRPILMTTFALTAGMVPIAIGRGEGAGFRAPLGVAVIGGVLTSTLLTLLVIPTIYEILDEWRTALARRLGMKPKQMTAEHPAPGLAATMGHASGD